MNLREIFLDASFYVSVSFLVLVVILFLKGRKKIASWLGNYSQSIAQNLQDAELQKKQAQQDFDFVQYKYDNIQETLSDIEEKGLLDLPSLQKNLDQEATKISFSYQQQIKHLRNIQFQQEYAMKVDQLCERFRKDMAQCSQKEKQELLDQAIDLISQVQVK